MGEEDLVRVVKAGCVCEVETICNIAGHWRGMRGSQSPVLVSVRRNKLFLFSRGDICWPCLAELVTGWPCLCCD